MQRTASTLADVGLLGLRLTVGGLMAGHGAQKLFGTFGGYGLDGTAGWLETLGLKPGKTWAYMAGGGEFGSGVLTALGLLGPVGPISMWGPMVMAWNKGHAGKPIWAASGGAELPLVYMAASAALALAGPGRYSIDRAAGIKVPAALTALTIAGVAAGVAVGSAAQAPTPDPVQEAASDQIQGGETAENSDTALAS